MDDNFSGGKTPPGLGTELGLVTLDDGSTVEGGKVLMKDQWNSDLYHPLAKEAEPHDLRLYKNRLSGFWGGTEVEDALRYRGIRTLIFPGGNTDQCVACSLTDAVHRSWDCLLLSDGCSTTSPEYAQKCVEFNMGGWGFLLTCKDLADGVVEPNLRKRSGLEHTKMVLESFGQASRLNRKRHNVDMKNPCIPST